MPEDSSEIGLRRRTVHVVRIDDPQWEDYLRFRDMLRADDQLRDRYGALKLELRAVFPEDREAYTNGKASFISQLLER